MALEGAKVAEVRESRAEWFGLSLWLGPVQTVLSEDGSVHRVKGRIGVEIK